MENKEWVHDPRIKESWNQELADRLLGRLEERGTTDSDYYANRLLTQSVNILGAGKSAFRLADHMLSCFLGEDKTRSQGDILAAMEEYNFNGHLRELLSRVKGREFDHKWNRSEALWVDGTVDILAVYIATEYAAKTLYSALKDGRHEAYGALSTEFGRRVKRKMVDAGEEV